MAGSSRADWETCCAACALIGKVWGLGDVSIGEVTRASAAYVCGYILKKMTGEDDDRLLGRCPEFTRMSRMPGLGYYAMADMASVVLEHVPLDGGRDVPGAIRSDGRVQPIGRYLRDVLRLHCGLSKGAKEETLSAIEEEMRPVREAAFEKSKSFKSELVESSEGARTGIERRAAIFKQGKRL